MIAIWEESFKIHTYEVDLHNRLKVSSIFNFMQEAAGSHANNLKIGYEELLKEGLFWVLSRIRIELLELPGFGEEIKILTWPKGTNKLFALRDFLIYNSHEEILGKATTAWLIIDRKTKRPQKIEPFAERFVSIEDKHALEVVPAKIAVPRNKELIYEKKVGYTEIDVNDHVNNARYVEWIMDSFPKDVYEKNRLDLIQVNFLSESRLGEEIEIFMADISPAYYYTEGISKNTNAKVFQATTRWRNNGIQ